MRPVDGGAMWSGKCGGASPTLRVEANWLELAVEEGLEDGGGGEGVELFFLFGAGEFFAGFFALGELLLGFEGAETFVNEEEGEFRFGLKLMSPVNSFFGGGAEGVVHVEGEADDQAF